MGASKIHVVCDSTAYITSDWLKKYPNVHVVPLTVDGDSGLSFEDWLENNDKLVEEMAKLKKKNTIPATSQPAPAKFINVFIPLIDEGHEIIVVTMSSRLSGTHQSALAAANSVDAEKISVIDSCTTAPGLRMLVEYAVQEIESGSSRSAVVDALEERKGRINVLLVPDSLEYLKRGGRIGGARALLGTALNIKPVLYLTKSGEIDVLDKVRTLKKAYKRMADEVPGDFSKIAIAHFKAEQSLQILKELLEDKGIENVRIEEIGPVITTHVGPGVVGLIFERSS